MAMKFRLPPNAFPPLALSRDEKQWLRDEMNAVVAETMRAERRCVNPREGRAAFPKHQWRAVRSRDDFVVYKQRRGKRAPSASYDETLGAPVDLGASMRSLVDSRAFSVDSMRSNDELPVGPEPTSVRSASSGWTASSGEDHESIVASMKDPHVPMLMAAGTVDGTLDDTVFGALAGDDVAWRTRTTYVKDKFADARILAKIDGPTAEDPFRSLCVKWFTKEVPAVVGSFIQRRDFLILEATGSGTESDGTRYGYYMIHSIKLPGVPELTDLNVIRCKVSLCFISRERSPQTSHLFARGFSDARGEMIETVGVALTAESIIAATLVVEAATVKKLTWLMQKKKRARQQRVLAAASAALPSECEACHRAVQKFSLSKHLQSCQACGLMVCSKCVVQKRLVVDVTGDGVVDRQLTFCFGCVLEAKRASSWEVAVDAQLGDGKQRVAPAQRHHASVHKPMPPQPSLARSQSDFSASRSSSIYAAQPVDFSASRSSSIYASQSARASTVFAQPASDGARHTIVRPHSSKSVAGVVLY